MKILNFTLIFLFFCIGNVHSNYPLLEQRYLDFTYDLATIESKEEFVISMLSHGGLVFDNDNDKEKIVSYILGENLAEAKNWANLVLTDENRTAAEEYFAAFILANRLQSPYDNLNDVYINIENKKNPGFQNDRFLYILITRLKVAVSNDISFPFYGVSENYQKYLPGLKSSLAESEISEIKLILENLKKVNAQDIKNSIILSRIYLAQTFDLEFIENVLSRNIDSVNQSELLYSICFQNNKNYTELMIEIINEAKVTDFQNLIVNAGTQNEIENQVFFVRNALITFLYMNRDEKEVNNLIYDMCLNFPGYFYTDLDRLFDIVEFESLDSMKQTRLLTKINDLKGINIRE